MQLEKVEVRINVVGILRVLFVKIEYVQMHQFLLQVRVVVELG